MQGNPLQHHHLCCPTSQNGPTCVLAVVALQVLQEVVDHWHGDDVADVLAAGQALEGNAHLQESAMHTCVSRASLVLLLEVLCVLPSNPT